MLYPIGSLLGPLLSGALTLRFNYSIMNDVMGNYTLFSLFPLSHPPDSQRDRYLLKIFSWFEFHMLYDCCSICRITQKGSLRIIAVGFVLWATELFFPLSFYYPGPRILHDTL